MAPQHRNGHHVSTGSPQGTNLMPNSGNNNLGPSDLEMMANAGGSLSTEAMALHHSNQIIR